jgi:hypothetical protein
MLNRHRDFDVANRLPRFRAQSTPAPDPQYLRSLRALAPALGVFPPLRRGQPIAGRRIA